MLQFKPAMKDTELMTPEMQQAAFDAWLQERKPAALVRAELQYQEKRDAITAFSQELQQMITDHQKAGGLGGDKPIAAKQSRLKQIKAEMIPLRAELSEQRRAFGTSLSAALPSYLGGIVAQDLLAVAERIERTRQHLVTLWKFTQMQGLTEHVPNYIHHLPGADDLRVLARRLGAKD